MVNKGRSLAGERHPRAKLSDEQVIAIYHSKERTIPLSQLYNVSTITITLIKSGKTRKNPGLQVRGSTKFQPGSKLTDAQVIEIRSSKLPQKEAAKLFGVCPATIMRIRNNQTRILVA